MTTLVAAVMLWMLKWSAPPPLVRWVTLASASRVKVSAPAPPFTVVVVARLVLVCEGIATGAEADGQARQATVVDEG